MPTSKFVSRLLQTAILVLLVANAAWATFPGKNGRLVFVMSVNGGWQLFTINPDGTDLQQLTNLPPTGFPVLDPVYSPDGSQVVFSHDMTGAVELYVVNADGTDLRQVTHDNGENLFPIWSPTGYAFCLAGCTSPPISSLIIISPPSTPMAPDFASSHAISSTITSPPILPMVPKSCSQVRAVH